METSNSWSRSPEDMKRTFESDKAFTLRALRQMLVYLRSQDTPEEKEAVPLVHRKVDLAASLEFDADAMQEVKTDPLDDSKYLSIETRLCDSRIRAFFGDDGTEDGRRFMKLWADWLVHVECPRVLKRCEGAESIHMAQERLREGDRRGAYLILASVMESDPIRPEPWGFRAFLRREDGELEEALKDANRALELAPGHEQTLQTRVLIHQDRGDPQAVIDDCTQLIKSAPQDAVVWSYRAVARGRLEDLAGCRDDCENWILLCPEEPAAWSWRGWARGRLGDKEGAIADLSKALELAPEDWADKPWAERWIRWCQGESQTADN